jgi:hypothetical protein
MATELDRSAQIAKQAANYPPALAERYTRFAHALPPELGGEFWGFIWALDFWARGDTLDDEREIWEQVLAHVPGLAPALRLVKRHVIGSVDGCQAKPGAKCPFSVDAAA